MGGWGDGCGVWCADVSKTLDRYVFVRAHVCEEGKGNAKRGGKEGRRRQGQMSFGGESQGGRKTGQEAYGAKELVLTAKDRREILIRPVGFDTVGPGVGEAGDGEAHAQPLQSQP